MMHLPLAPLAVTLALAGAAGPASAQEISSGQRDYAEVCSRCHGASGKGDGVVARPVNLTAPDLAGIQRANGGVFPSGLLYEIIEGGGSTSVHGTREMPAWGTRFMAESEPAPGLAQEPGVREAAVRERITALVAFIATMQLP